MTHRCSAAPTALARRALRLPRARTAMGALATLALVLQALLLAGCGPGLGGTGTGMEPEPLTALGATEVSVCTADFGDLLGCRTNPSTSAAAQPTTAAVHWADPNAPADTQLELQAQQAQLKLRCAGWLFTGRYAQRPGQTPRYVGQFEAAGSVVALATLEVSRNGSGLNVTLADPAGRVLAGPLLMQPVATPATGGRCG